MPAIIFLLAVLIVPGIPGSAVVPRWALLACVVPFIWYFAPPAKFTLGHLLGFIFLAWCALSLSWTFNFDEGTYQLGQFVVLGLIFCIGANIGNLQRVYIAAGIGAALNSVAVVAQYFFGDAIAWQFQDKILYIRDILPQTVPPAGFFFNKNFTAEFCAMALVGCLGLGAHDRWRWLALGAIPSLWFCHSRAAEIALVCAAILLIYKYSKVAAAALTGVISLIGLYLWDANYSAAMRLNMWLDAWDGMTFLGKGIGSFYGAFPEHASRIDALALRPSQVHNDLLQISFETGPGVLAIIGLLVFALRAKPLRTEHYVLAIFLVIGLVGFPLYMPATAAFAALVLGSLCHGRDELQLPFALRRSRIRGGQVQFQRRQRSIGAPSAGAAARALESRHPGWRGLFFHQLSTLRRSLSGDRDP